MEQLCRLVEKELDRIGHYDLTTLKIVIMKVAIENNVSNATVKRAFEDYHMGVR